MFDGHVTYEVRLNPILGAGAFDAFPKALNICDNYVSHIVSSPGGGVCLILTEEVLVSGDVLPTWFVPLSSQLPFITLFCTLFMAHLGYSLGCGKSSSKSLSVVLTNLALWVSVPMTLYLEERLW